MGYLQEANHVWMLEPLGSQLAPAQDLHTLLPLAKHVQYLRGIQLCALYYVASPRIHTAYVLPRFVVARLHFLRS